MGREKPWSRRHFLQASGAAISVSALAAAEQGPRTEPAPRPTKSQKKLAVVTTAYYYLSHAYHICGRFLYGYLRDGKLHYPDFDLAAMYVEQKKEGDLSVELSGKHGFTIYPDIASALTLGGDKLAVDGVLLIGEHGDYPFNAKLQKLYPRFPYFQKIVELFRRSGKTVPVFCDKHLSYDRKLAREMVQTARNMGFPLYAGSSLPITWRRPEMELPVGVKIQEGLIATRGELEIYGFHGLESLQCMVERRKPADQGVKSVTCLEGDEVWKAGDQGRWSWELLEQALSRSPSLNVGDIRENCRHFVPLPGRPTFLKSPIAFLIEYRDGLRGTMMFLNGHHDDTSFAARIEGQSKPVSTLFYLPPPPGAGYLGALAMKVEEFMTTGKPPAPVERTLLTGGMLDYALESRHRGHVKLETPDLSVSYDPPAETGYMRGEAATHAG